MSEPEPLVVLDPAGKPTPVSYDVPEPTSYSGHNYIYLPFPDQAFRPILTQPSPPPAQIIGRPETTNVIAGHPDTPAETGTPSWSNQQILAAPGISLNGPPNQVVVAGSRALSPRLQRLTREELTSLQAAGQQVVLYTNTAGALDYRATAIPTGPPAGGDGGSGGSYPVAVVSISSPADHAVLTGDGTTLNLTILGSTMEENADSHRLQLAVDGGQATDVSLQANGAWQATVQGLSAGDHTIEARFEVKLTSHVPPKKTLTATDTKSVTITAAPTAGQGGSTAPPAVAISEPGDRAVLLSTGDVVVTVKGIATCDAATSIASVTVVDPDTGESTTIGALASGETAWSAQLLLKGQGDHKISATAQDAAGQTSAAASVAVTVTDQPPRRRLKQRLLLVETLNLSSFLGAFGAGRVLKTFTLLPGEQTTISVKSWTKSDESTKSGSSIVDSNSLEASSSFDDALSREQTTTESQTEASAYGVNANVSACWGWGAASISASYSGSANSAREDTVKNISSAVRKHSMQASSNRNLTVNTEYTASHSEGQEDSTVRQISNVNVSRVLNFAFRQMNQEHLTLIHLTNVRVAYYCEDLMLDANGNPATVVRDGKTVLDIRPTYREVALPDLMGLLADVIVPEWQVRVIDAITNALSGIPDYQDTLQMVYEVVTPIKDGQPVEGAEYLRFKKGLTTTFVDPASNDKTFVVPGIVLSYDRIVMRTEGIMVDSILGVGDGLDPYAHGLQTAAITERQIGVNERQAKLDQLELARTIVANKDKEAAALYAQVFALPPVAPLIDIHSNGNAPAATQ